MALDNPLEAAAEDFVRLLRVVEEDAAGRRVSTLLYQARLIIEEGGGGPIADALHKAFLAAFEEATRG